MNKRCLVTVEGGLGKHVMFTSILPFLKEKYEEVYVASAYYDVMQACSLVDEAFPFGQPSLYQDIALDEEVDILWREPYSNSDFIRKKTHLFNAWLQEYGLQDRITEEGPSHLTPVVDRSFEVFPQLKANVEQILNQTHNDFIIVQFSGGQSPLDPNMQNMPYNITNEALKRNYQHGQALINKLHEAYPNTAILHFGLKNEPSYEFTSKIEMPYLAWLELSRNAKKVVTTDSSMQHIATAANAPDITVIWGETRPEHFGYARNKNIAAKHVRNTQPYFKPLGASPAIVRFPTPDEVMEVVTR